MNAPNKKTVRGKLVLAVFGVMLLGGLGLGSNHALAWDGGHSGNHRAGDGRYVMIGNARYDVMHDGQGPNVVVAGQKYYLDAPSNDSRVLVAGKWYDVQGHEYYHHDHYDHHDHHDHHHHHHN